MLRMVGGWRGTVLGMIHAGVVATAQLDGEIDIYMGPLHLNAGASLLLSSKPRFAAAVWGSLDFELDLGDSTLRLRPGRQMLSFGAQRLISPLPWANVWRSWEGLTALWRGGDWEIT